MFVYFIRKLLQTGFYFLVIAISKNMSPQIQYFITLMFEKLIMATVLFWNTQINYNTGFFKSVLYCYF